MSAILTGFFCGSAAPIEFPEADIRAVLARPGVLEDISSAYDSPAHTIDEWVEVIGRQLWLTGDGVRATVGTGPTPTTVPGRSTSCSGGSWGGNRSVGPQAPSTVNPTARAARASS